MKEEYYWMDQGIQTMRMLLVPHRESWQKSNVVRIAEEFMTRCPITYQGIHTGKLPKTGSFLSVDAPNVIVASVKQSENGEDIIVRCVEATGKQTTAALDLKFAHLKWTGDFRPSEIKTLRITKTGTIKVVNLLEE